MPTAKVLERARAILLLGGLILVGEPSQVCGEEGLVPPGPETLALLQGAVGDPDPAVPHRLARLLGPENLLRAFYGGSHTERLVALDAAAGCLHDPWAVLPSLAALMGARDRQVASSATRALLSILSRGAHRPMGFIEEVPARSAQLAGQLVPLALDSRFDVDIRGAALLGLKLLGIKDVQDRPWVSELLGDSETEIRRAVLGMLDPPLGESMLSRLAGVAAGDSDPITRGLAAAMLCENAVAHGVEALSEDLKGILKKVIGDAQAPAEAIGPSLACLNHFPTEARVDLIDLALAHPDPAVEAFWKDLQGE